MIKKNIFKSLVALMLLATLPACTDEVPVDGNTQGDVVLRPEGDRITSLKNILPSNKPGYQGVDGRAYNKESNAWNVNDELLLKVVIKGTEDYPVYTAYMKLVCGSDNKWSIAENQYFTSYQSTESSTAFGSNLSLVTPTTGIVLTGDGANFEAIIPEEIVIGEESPLTVTMMYAPDLEWTATTTGEGDAATVTGIALSLKTDASTPTPEVWEVKANSNSSVVAGGTEATDENVWDTSLARVCVETGTAGDIVTLTSTGFAPYEGFEKSTDGIYKATTTGTDGIAYFYGTIGTETPVTDGFKISLDKVKLSSSESEEPTDVFIPTTLFEANALTEVSLKPAVSYKLDGTSTRTQAADDSKSAVVTEEGGKTTYKVSGVKGLLEWACAVNSDQNGTSSPNLILKNDIVMPPYEINISNGYTYGDYEEITTSNWKTVGPNDENTGYTGVINGNGHTIFGLYQKPAEGEGATPKRNAFVNLGTNGVMHSLIFDDATNFAMVGNWYGAIVACGIKSPGCLMKDGDNFNENEGSVYGSWRYLNGTEAGSALIGYTGHYGSFVGKENTLNSFVNEIPENVGILGVDDSENVSDGVKVSLNDAIGSFNTTNNNIVTYNWEEVYGDFPRLVSINSTNP